MNVIKSRALKNHSASYCPHACLGREGRCRQPVPCAASCPSQWAKCEHQAENETSGACTCHSGATENMALAQDQCAQTSNDTCTTCKLFSSGCPLCVLRSRPYVRATQISEPPCCQHLFPGMSLLTWRADSVMRGGTWVLPGRACAPAGPYGSEDLMSGVLSSRASVPGLPVVTVKGPTGGGGGRAAGWSGADGRLTCFFCSRWVSSAWSCSSFACSLISSAWRPLSCSCRKQRATVTSDQNPPLVWHQKAFVQLT